MVSKQDILAEKARLAGLASFVIDKARKRAGLKRKDLANKLGIPPSRVTKVLDGQSNVTLQTLASFGLACGVRFRISVVREGGER